jgi:hypothetical protein
MLGADCGKDSSGPSDRAASVTGIVGDGQSAPPNTILPIPLSFVVLGANGAPLANATVNWTVTTGQAAVNPASSRSDASGSASTTVTLGSTVGPVNVRATVGSVTQNFSLTTIDPCEFDIPYSIGTTVNGTLTTSDCRIDPGYYYDFYGFTVGTQQGLTATMSAATFDTYLELFRGAGSAATFMGFNDDISGADLNSQVEAILPSGSYVLGANSALTNATGAYSLSTAVRPQTITGCEILWTTRGISVTETIEATDCTDTAGGGRAFGDAIAVFARAGTSLNLAHRSTAFDPLLRLFRADAALTLVAGNDDSSATNTNSFISYAVTQDAVFVIFIGTADSVQTGAYTFEVKASTGPITSSGIEWMPRLNGMAARLRFRPLQLPERWKPRAN